MRRQTRPAHHRLSPLEMAAWNDAEQQRNRESGFLAMLFLALSPMVVVIAIATMAAWGWL